MKLYIQDLYIFLNLLYSLKTWVLQTVILLKKIKMTLLSFESLNTMQVSHVLLLNLNNKHVQWRIIYGVVFCFSRLFIFKKGNGLQACIKYFKFFFLCYALILKMLYSWWMFYCCVVIIGELYLGKKGDLLFE